VGEGVGVAVGVGLGLGVNVTHSVAAAVAVVNVGLGPGVCDWHGEGHPQPVGTPLRCQSMASASKTLTTWSQFSSPGASGKMLLGQGAGVATAAVRARRYVGSLRSKRPSQLASSSEPMGTGVGDGVGLGVGVGVAVPHSALGYAVGSGVPTPTPAI
jgi:hypothetical protein